jgi:hypothetical protein
MTLLECGGGVTTGGGGDGATPDAGAGDSAPAALADATETGGDGAATVTPDATESCPFSGTSTLPGVSIRFTSTCSFSVAQAKMLKLPYEVVVEHDIAGVVPVPQDAGNCGAAGPSQLVVFESLSGGGQSYCLCDTGLCAPSSRTPVTLHAGTYAGVFMWQGRNWSGPSDTGNPMGAPFPPGGYTLSLSAKGAANGASFTVTATMGITLTP